MQIKTPPQLKKLIQTLLSKQNYTTQYEALKVYVEQGLVVIKLLSSTSFFIQTREVASLVYDKIKTDKRNQPRTNMITTSLN